MNSPVNTLMKHLLLSSVLVLGLTTPQYSRGLLKHSWSKQRSFCGTYPGRVDDEIRRSQDVQRAFAAQNTSRRAVMAADASQDIGQIAVVQDDGSVILPRNVFDLGARALHLAPDGPSSFRLTQRVETIGTNQGSI